MSQIMKIKTILFGETEYTIDSGGEYDLQNIVLNDITSTCGVFISEGLDREKLLKAVNLLDEIEKLDNLSRKKLLESYSKNNYGVRDFVEEHYNEYHEETKLEIFSKLNITEQDNIKFLKNMELGHIFVYEEATRGMCATLDYNLIWEEGSTFTDQILAVSFNSDMQFLSIAHES